MEKPPAIDIDLVRTFVAAAHGDLEETKDLLEQEPGLVNATYDWGGGDFETALGGASHMGRRDIAEYLLSKGARMDVFAAAMLGRVELVRAFITDDPQIVRVRGPHGIGLRQHAVAGGSDGVVAMLDALGR